MLKIPQVVQILDTLKSNFKARAFILPKRKRCSLARSPKVPTNFGQWWIYYFNTIKIMPFTYKTENLPEKVKNRTINRQGFKSFLSWYFRNISSYYCSFRLLLHGTACVNQTCSLFAKVVRPLLYFKTDTKCQAVWLLHTLILECTIVTNIKLVLKLRQCYIY